MAKQHGPISLTGQLGGVSFYRMKGKYYARRKTEHNVATDPRFTRTHLNSLDFGTAHRASMLLREALGPDVAPCSDTYMASRMTGAFVKVVHADTTHARGERKVLNANLPLLKGFEFNKHKTFEASAPSTSTVSIDRASSQIKISLANTPPETAPMQLVACIVYINFKKGTYTRHNTTLSPQQTKSKPLLFQIPPHTDPHAAIIVTLGSHTSGTMTIAAIHQQRECCPKPSNSITALINQANHTNPKNPSPDRRRLTFLLASFVLTTTAWSQITITGTVVSKEDHSPLPAVNAVVKGTQNGTITNSDGVFSLTVTDPNAILVFSFVGMVTQEYALNGQTTILIRMKSDCIRDYFDVQRIGLYASSGLIHTPVGGKLTLAFPPYFGKGTLVGGIGYQTDLGKNKFLNAQAELKHFVWTCNFDMDANWYYRKVDFDDSFNARAYSFETNFSFQRLTFIAGYSNLSLNNLETVNKRTLSGPILGVGSWIGGPLRLSTSAKAAIYNGHVEYMAQIKRESRPLDLFLKFYNLDSFTELTLGIGTQIGYRLKKKQRNS